MIKQAIANGMNVTEVFVDTVGPPHTYQAKLKHIFPKIDISVSKKADDLFPIVSAASIVAKVTRDLVLNGWILEGDDESKQGVQWGSGYPSDVRTKNWMKNNLDKVFGFPTVVRFSWKPCVEILEVAAVKVEFDESAMEIDQHTPKKPRSRSNSMISSSSLKKSATRPRYFDQSKMDIVTDL